MIWFAFILIFLLFFIAFKYFYLPNEINKANEIKKTFKKLEEINDDIYDIKHHLGLEATVRTASKQFDVVLNYIDKRIEQGYTKQNIIESLVHANEEGNFGTKTVGPIDIDHWKNYLENHEKLYGSPK